MVFVEMLFAGMLLAWITNVTAAVFVCFATRYPNYLGGCVCKSNTPYFCYYFGMFPYRNIDTLIKRFYTLSVYAN